MMAFPNNKRFVGFFIRYVMTLPFWGSRRKRRSQKFIYKKPKIPLVVSFLFCIYKMILYAKLAAFPMKCVSKYPPFLSRDIS